MSIVEIRVPEIGESVTEVTLSQWLKSDGDYVEMDEEIAEFESDKATLEFPSPNAGILHIIAEEGSDLQVGDLVCKIDTAAAKPAATATPATTPSPEPTPVAKADPTPVKAEPVSSGKPGKVEEIRVPEIGESINEVTLVAWLKEDGDIVALDEEIAEFDSDKATLEFPSPFAGKLKIIASEGEDLKVGDLVCTIDTGFAGASAPAPSAATPAPAAQPAPTPAPAPTPTPQPAPATKSHATGHPSPAAAKAMAENNIAPTQISGSGPDGRITKQDVLAFLRDGGTAPADQVVAAVEASGGSREQSRKKMSRMRRTISRRLVAVKNETAMLTTFNDVDMSKVMAIRNQYKKVFEEKHGIRLGFMSFFIKACANALMKYPAVNAYIDGDDMITNNFADVSIAVSTPKGLVVPVIRNAESLSMAGLEGKVRELAKKGRDGNLSLEEMTGGTFTITNGGVFGSLMSTPIINAPQSAILGMHRIEERPVVIDGQVVVKPMMYLALSYDHRIIDGKESVGFLVEVKNQLQNPEQLLLGADPVKLVLGL
ncbi:MAG: 2-oxoglutarate dehydrogenase complex dihydrolipoyllysine-residue succinyltransferase [Saprospiraceae bacterium]|nr:2-oxoglutarate dehydrogenase complex dihydrolipoyllysine-residue succinyltransferase [Saprospiraceae bacterium]